MKRIMIIAMVGLALLAPGSADATSAPASAETASYQIFKGDKEARKQRKELRKAKRAEYRSRPDAPKHERKRIMRENYKQRKKMDKAKKRSRGERWDGNARGNVFHL